ncbi:MAG: transglutaminase domain-containing protein [Deltaproteobacteria bacterium]|nr:transglutaminase domain-containing protein [Deltaproteobacteria bacterium]
MKKLVSVTTIIIFLALTGVVWAKSNSGTITMEFDLSAHEAGQKAVLWIPYPTSDEHQLITNVNVEGNHVHASVYTDRKFQTPMLSVRWDENIKNRKLTFSFDVERQEVIRRNFPAQEAAWEPADYAMYLAPTSLGPADGKIKELADKITAGQATVRGKAKAIYDWTCKNMYRDPKTRGCGVGDVCALLEKPGGKCADIHSFYVTLARAAGVPAREVFGIRQGKKPVQDITTWQHCWAEFYLPGYGWVPVDPGDVRKMMLKENLKLADAKTAEYRAYFWGGIDPYRVKLGRGRDLTLNPPQKGEKVNYLMYPFAQIGGETLDWLDPKTFKYTITYRQ